MTGSLHVLPPKAWHLVPEDRYGHSTDADAPCPCGATVSTHDPRDGSPIRAVWVHRQRFTRAEHRPEPS